jgi:photosystem II stability/assembly factor-like uncharacterized protein
MTRWMGLAGSVTLVCAVSAQGTWAPQASGTTERFRGVSAVSERIAWASGSKGTVVRTIDGGATWTAVPPPDAAALDFRDIEAFDANTAYVLSIGNGDMSRIYKTADGGKTWALQFTSADPKSFYDAIAFWDARTGLAFGDPVDGRFTVIRTDDGGRTWAPVPSANLPPALEGEGAFAASGTCLVVEGTANVWFGTGGAARARVFRSTDRGLTWSVADTPIMAGNASSGIFSLAFADGRRGIAVGGDYRKERESGDNLAFTSDGGQTWAFQGVASQPASATDSRSRERAANPVVTPARLRSFRSAVAFVPGTKGLGLVAVGPGGTDISRDGGVTWAPLGEDGYHAFSFARGAAVGWAAGEQGRLASYR